MEKLKKHWARLKALLRGQIASTRRQSLRHLRWCVDRPNRALKVIDGPLFVYGWGADLSSGTVATVRVRLGNAIYRPYKIARGEVPMVFASACVLPKEVGFFCVLQPPAGLHRFWIDIQDAEGTWVPVHHAFLLKMPRRHAEVAMRPYRGSVGREVAPVVIGRDPSIAVAYLLRGADENWLQSARRFIESYRRYPAGQKHTLFVLLKGFADAEDMEKARGIFQGVEHETLLLDDGKYDLGAYIEWANKIENEMICMFNTTSEILAPDWLRKFAANLMLPNVGLVGATASFESLRMLDIRFPKFPNAHIRTNAFMIERALLLRIADGFEISDKWDVWFMESGPDSLTRAVLNTGKEILVIGRDGRGYPPEYWSISGTFRQGKQENLLIADNRTRDFAVAPEAERRLYSFLAWGNDSLVGMEEGFYESKM